MQGSKPFRRQWRDYRTAAGGRPVKDFISSLTDEELAEVVAGMKEVQTEGLSAARHLEDDIHEVRAFSKTRDFRVYLRRKDASVRCCPHSQRSRLSDWRARGAKKRKVPPK